MTRQRNAAGAGAFFPTMADSIGPYDHPPIAHLDDRARRELLGRALRGVERGAYDERVVAWLAEQDAAVLHSVVGMVERARRVEREAAAGRPLRGANLDDFLALLEAVRDALAAGRGDLAAMVLQPLLEHRGALGKRSRAAAALLRAQLTEPDPQPRSDRDEAGGAGLNRPGFTAGSGS
jgi:hypothetical protein